LAVEIVTGLIEDCYAVRIAFGERIKGKITIRGDNSLRHAALQGRIKAPVNRIWLAVTE
jgi:hypothetical protein